MHEKEEKPAYSDSDSRVVIPTTHSRIRVFRYSLFPIIPLLAFAVFARDMIYTHGCVFAAEPYNQRGPCIGV